MPSCCSYDKYSTFIETNKYLQKQPPEVFYSKKCSENFLQNSKEKPVPGSLFWEKKKRFWHRCFPVNSTGFLRTSFLQNTSTSVSINSTISLKPFTPSKLNLASYLSKIGNSLIDDWDKIRLASSFLLFFLPLPIFP